jgi:7,8-dihydropterin-6-yl-methyl-4-(beta-D-ribofuranosyl)aminobenzene 5'-phosphate synthase
MRITTLVENSPHPSIGALKAEHGLSFYIEHGDHCFLSDVGASEAFAENARLLDVDLTRVEALAITHHHYDHGGGLDRFLSENLSGKVFLRQSPVKYFFDKKPFKSARYIGLDQTVLDKYADRIDYLVENREILPGIHLLTTIPQIYPKPSGDKRLRMRSGFKSPQDTFEHELVTVLGDEEGLVLLTGCAHNSVLNMIEAVKIALPGLPIRAVIGGFHLGHEKEATVQEIGEALLESNIPAIFTGHCTGDTAYAVLKLVLGDRLHKLHTGLVLEL